MPWHASRSSRAVSIVVVGRTYRMGTDGYNQRLSEGLAQSVKGYSVSAAGYRGVTPAPLAMAAWSLLVTGTGQS